MRMKIMCGAERTEERAGIQDYLQALLRNCAWFAFTLLHSTLSLISLSPLCQSIPQTRCSQAQSRSRTPHAAICLSVRLLAFKTPSRKSRNTRRRVSLSSFQLTLAAFSRACL